MSVKKIHQKILLVFILNHVVYTKMEILSSFTHSHDVPNLYDFLSSV